MSTITRKCQTKKGQTAETCKALLNTGARLFATRGFHGVSVRELTREAGVNLATISYHFGGKSGLYEAIIRFIIERRDALHPSEADILAKWAECDDTPQAKGEVVDWFTTRLVHGLLGPDDQMWPSILLSREITQPTEIFPLLEAEFFTPARAALEAFVRGVLPPETDRDEVIITAQFIINMPLKFLEGENLISNWLGWDGYGEEGIKKIARVMSKRTRGLLGLPME